MPKNVLAVGDINVDVMMGGLASLPVVDKEITCETFEVVMGSSAVIFAAAYAALGGQISFLGLAGVDDYGDFMLRGMESFGIRTNLVRRTSRVKTGVTVNLIYGTTRSQVTYPGTIAEFSGEDVDRATLQEFDHVHFAGPYQQTRFRPHISRLLGLCRELNISTSLDPQWDASERWEYMDQWLGLLTYLFVNQDEAVSISRTATVDAACAWLAGRTASPLVKAGSEGAYVCHNQATALRVPSIPVSVVDTTGAGDTFDAAFLLASLERGMTPEAAAAFATAAAARSCLFVGGTAARSSYEDVLTFAAERRK